MAGAGSLHRPTCLPANQVGASIMVDVSATGESDIRESDGETAEIVHAGEAVGSLTGGEPMDLTAEGGPEDTVTGSKPAETGTQVLHGTFLHPMGDLTQQVGDPQDRAWEGGK